MECKNTVIHGENCGKPRVKEEHFSPDEIKTGSQTSHVQQNENIFMRCVLSSDVDTKVGIKQETWDPNIAFSHIKSGAKQHFTCLGRNTIKGKDEIDIKEHGIQDDLSHESERCHLQQTVTNFVEYGVSGDVDNKVGIKQEVLDPNGVSSLIKYDPEQPPVLVPILGSGTINGDIGTYLKVEQCNQHEISPGAHKLHLQQNEAHIMKNKVSSGVESNVEVKQEAWNPNGMSSDIKYDPEHPLTLNLEPHLGTDTLNAGDEIDIKEELWYCEETSVDSLNEAEESGSKQDETAKDVALFESIRPYTYAVNSTNAAQKQANKDVSSWLVETNMPAQKCQSRYTCTICMKNFKLLTHLQKHNLIHKDSRLKTDLVEHDDKIKYKCQICDKGLKQSSDLKSHLLVHDDKRIHTCQICGKSFKRLGDVKAHLLVHDDKRQYKCEICEKCFKQLGHLKTHLLVHDDKRQSKCQICVKSFKRLGDLKTHLLIHDDERQYKCQICGKRFKHKSYLKKHLMLHDDKRQCKCQICEKSFKQLSYLKRHLLVHDTK